MKQILQSLRTGEIEVVDAPCPALRPGHLLIRTRASLISAGTERMLLQFGKANWLEKARQQPDKVRQVLDKVRTDGLWTTLEAVRSKLDQPLPLGYCNVGEVLEVGGGVEGFEVGERVISNGGHAEVVCVPKNLCAKIPEAVSDEDAAFTVVGAIGLQGIRLLEPTLGEAICVTGLGLIGLLAVQLLRAHGCRVLGADFDAGRLARARELGAETVDLAAGEDLVAAAQSFSRGRGMDGVLITASTKSDEPMRQAAHMCRQRGRIVLVGVTGLKLSRADFYEKELRFQVSCSYGPGRYDSNYEEQGQDYPAGFVRWTEQRNFEAILDMLADGRMQGASLITHRIPHAEAAEAYTTIDSDKKALGVLLEYPSAAETAEPELRSATVPIEGDKRPARGRSKGKLRVSFVGAGNFASRVLIPAFRKADVELAMVASQGGLSALHAARRLGFAEATTDVERVFADESVDAVVVATRHDTHGPLVCRALEAGKHVFVEKPLAIFPEQVEQIRAARAAAHQRGQRPFVMVGFNRRFAPMVQTASRLLNAVAAPKSFVMTVNASALPEDNWAHDPQVGGGRIVAEACHFIDLLRHLCGSPIQQVQAVQLGGNAAGVCSDKVTILLSFEDGSFGTVHYLANGHRSFPKERLEVFCAGRVLQLDNFRTLRGYGWPGFRKQGAWRQDKGHAAEVQAFVQAAASGDDEPIPFEQLDEIARASFAAVESTETRSVVDLSRQPTAAPAAWRRSA